MRSKSQDIALKSGAEHFWNGNRQTSFPGKNVFNLDISRSIRKAIAQEENCLEETNEKLVEIERAAWRAKISHNES